MSGSVADWEMDQPLSRLIELRDSLDNQIRHSPDVSEALRTLVAQVEAAVVAVDIARRTQLIVRLKNEIQNHEEEIQYLQGKLPTNDN